MLLRAAKHKGLSFDAALEAVELLVTAALVGKEAADVVGVLLQHVSLGFSADAVASLLKALLESLEAHVAHDGAVFELLGRCLTRLMAEHPHDFDGESFGSPEALRAHVLARVVGSKWAPSFAVNLLGVFKDMPLSDTEQRSLVDKAFYVMESVEMAVLPSLVYQMLLCAPKDKGPLVLRVAEFFDRRHSGSASDAQRERLRQTEGTVLLHVDVALKQDASLATSFLKALQKEPFKPTPFMVAFVLAMSRAHRHEEAALKLLMQLVTASLQDEATASAHAWARAARKPRRESAPIRAVLLETVECAQHGWHSVVPQLVTLGFLCIEARTGKGRAAGVAAAALVHALGSELLEATFQRHPPMQGHIVQMLLARIATTSAEGGAFIALLGRLVARYTQQVSPFEAHLKEAFEYLTYLRPAVGLQLVEAVLPLLALSKAFQDHMMLVLRKTLFRGDLHSRLTAVGGFGRWALWVTRQRQVDSVLLFDLLSFLGRALTQQLAVRVEVYATLEELLRMDSEATGHVLETLSRQLERYTRAVVGGAPVQLDACLDGDHIVEPLGALVATCHRCASHALTHKLQDKRAAPLLKAVSDLASALLRCGPEDFGLDKAADYSESATGQRNVALASLLASLYVACMEAWLTEEPLSEERTRAVAALHAMHQDLLASAGGAAGAAAGEAKKKRKTAAAAAAAPAPAKRVALALDQQLLGLRAMRVLFATLATEGVGDGVPFQLIRDNKPLHRWTIEHLHRVVCATLRPVSGADEAVAAVARHTQADRQAFCLALARPVMDEYKRDLEDAALSTTVLETLHEMLLYAQATPGAAVALLNAGLPHAAHADAQTALSAHVHTLLAFVAPMVQAKNWREIVTLFQVCDVVAQGLAPEALQQLPDTARALLLEPLDNVGATRALVAFFMDLCLKRGTQRQGACELATEVKLMLAQGGGHRWRCITAKTWQAVATVVCQTAENFVSEAEWAAGVVKGNEHTCDYVVDDLRSALYQRVRAAMDILHTVAETALPWGPPAEQLLRLSTRLFKCMVGVTKTLLAQKHVPGPDLPALVRGLGSLIHALYEFDDDMTRRMEDERAAGEEEEGGGDAKATAKRRKQAASARAKREEKVQPALVYEIERLETSLLKYQQQCRVTLMTEWQRSAVHDFNLHLERVKNIVDQDDAGDAAAEEASGDDENDAQSGKRTREQATAKPKARRGLAAAARKKARSDIVADARNRQAAAE